MVKPSDDSDLTTHLLRMCPAKCQTQYDLMEKTTPVSIQALLPILEKIKKNAELDAKPPSMNKAKEAGEKCKMDSIDSQIPKKQKLVTFSKKYCTLCKKNRGPHKSHNTCNCRCFNSDGTPTKRNGGTGNKSGHVKKRCSKESQCNGANFPQII